MDDLELMSDLSSIEAPSPILEVSVDAYSRSRIHLESSPLSSLSTLSSLRDADFLGIGVADPVTVQSSSLSSISSRWGVSSSSNRSFVMDLPRGLAVPGSDSGSSSGDALSSLGPQELSANLHDFVSREPALELGGARSYDSSTSSRETTPSFGQGGLQLEREVERWLLAEERSRALTESVRNLVPSAAAMRRAAGPLMPNNSSLGGIGGNAAGSQAQAPRGRLTARFGWAPSDTSSIHLLETAPLAPAISRSRVPANPSVESSQARVVQRRNDVRRQAAVPVEGGGGSALNGEIEERQWAALESLLQREDEAFAEQRASSMARLWCDPVPGGVKADTILEFTKAFCNERTLEISSCNVCVLQKRPEDLEEIDWRSVVPSPIDRGEALEAIVQCRRCFPVAPADPVVPICHDCIAALETNRLPKTCMGDLAWMGCGHRYPEQLSELTPLEEKLIALNGTYGYIYKFLTKRGDATGPTYRKHVKGHILVFPNDVDTLASILPHPLVASLDTIHVVWAGPDRPAPADVSKLLSVRPGVIRRALRWLQVNNPLYRDIIVNHTEIDSWDLIPGSSVPRLVYDSMRREEIAAEELVRTAHIAPGADRGDEESGPGPDIEDVVHRLVRRGVVDGSDAMSDVDGGVAAAAGSNMAATFEFAASGLFDIDDRFSINPGDQVAFLGEAIQSRNDSMRTGDAPTMEVYATSGLPYIRVWGGSQFPDRLSPDFFAKTFPTSFPYGRGGPKAPVGGGDGAMENPVWPRDMSLSVWAKTVLRRRCGRLSAHPSFAFLVFNILSRSRNNRISMGRMRKAAFEKLEGIQERLTPERLRLAQEEMRETGSTSDVDVRALVKELFLYGSRHPLSNETRLSMRKKIWSMIVAFGLTAIWFTINPNDITNPVKLKLSAYQGRDRAAAELLLQALRRAEEATRLAMHDPLSSVLFFFREISLFFEHYVRVGRQSVFGKVSHYYATVETNDRGSFHLHGLLWLDGSHELADLVKDLAEPRNEEYRRKVKTYVDDVFLESLDTGLAVQGEQMGKRLAELDARLVGDRQALLDELEVEANFVASRSQMHRHTATCVKYSLRSALQSNGAGVDQRRPLCRFRFPLRLVPDTIITGDGLIEIRRNDPMVNRYNACMAVGLRHNHDLSFILTRKRGMALIHYICNYATKYQSPMWQRLVVAEELAELSRQAWGRPGSGAPAPGSDETLSPREKTRAFLLRVANKVFTSRELSQPEVLAHLLGFPTDFSDVEDWSWVSLASVYWTCARRWPSLQSVLAEHGMEAELDSVPFSQSGVKLPVVEAYCNRGAVLERLSLYEYLVFVKIAKKTSRNESRAIGFDDAAESCRGWVQILRPRGRTSVPVLDGKVSDCVEEEVGSYPKWNAVVLLALFVPWGRFLSVETDDFAGLWRTLKSNLCDRLQRHVRNINLLRVSADDAALDRKIRGEQAEEDTGAEVEVFEEFDAFSDAGEAAEDDAGIDTEDYVTAFVEVLASLESQSIGRLPMYAGLKSLRDSATGLELSSQDSPRGRQFYTLLQDVEDTPLRQVGLFSRREVEQIMKAQKNLDTEIRANISGGDGLDGVDGTAVAEAGVSGGVASSPDAGGQAAGMQLEEGLSASYVDAAMAAADFWTLNRLQALAVLQPAVFLDQRGQDIQEDGGPQHFQYVGGEGGTGKSRVIHAIRDIFRVKDAASSLLLTASSGNAAALIGGITIHSACGITFDGSRGRGTVSEGDKLRWKAKVVLVVDEISQVGGITLTQVDENLRQLRDDPHRPFGGVPVVLFFGDFFQFDPVMQTSLLLPRPRNYSRQRPEIVERHIRGHKLFRLFSCVVILTEQVRAAKCPRLRGVLTRLRDGQQTEEDFRALSNRLYNKPGQPTFVDGLRAITPLNTDRWDINNAAVIQWARDHGKHVSIFIAGHLTKQRRKLSVDELKHILQVGDDSQLATPGMFFYAQGMPVVVTKNQHVGLKLVNGGTFEAVDVIPDFTGRRVALASDVTLHLKPPIGILIQSPQIADIAIPGLPPGTQLVPSKRIAVPASFQGSEGPRARGRRGFQHVTHRIGPLCTPAFAMTDHKSQGKQFDSVLINLQGTRPGTPPSFMSLYVQLSRATSWDGLYLLRRPDRQDFIEPKITLDEAMREGVKGLQRLAEESRMEFEVKHARDAWFARWQAIE